MKNKKIDINKIGLVFLFICCALILGYAYTNNQSCAKEGCNNIKEEGSQYCKLHNPKNKSSIKNIDILETMTEDSTIETTTTEELTEITTFRTYKKSNSDYTYKNNNSYNYSGSYKSKNSSYNSSNSYKYSTPKSYNSSSKKSYNTYDEGYDSVYEDEDYDDERYKYDKDYADGVDDALEDLEEEGRDW